MIERIKEHLSSIYIDQFKTWSKVSLDDSNNESMIINEEKCFDYDSGISKLHNSEYPPRCVDGVIIKNNTLYFIEFKNGVIDKKIVTDLRLKACESLIELSNILKKDGIEIEYNELVSLKTKFILVYNLDKNILKEKVENINQGFLKETIQFTNAKKFLSKYKGILYDEVHFINPEVFIKNFIEK